MSFLVLALPRSRTFWLSRYLSYGDWYCGHEELRHARSLDDIQRWISQPCTGTIETSATPWWRLIPHYDPNMRIVTIRRPVDAVIASLAKLGFATNDAFVANIKMLDRKLDQLESRLPNVLSLRYHELDAEDGMAQLFEWCLPYQHDPTWFKAMSELNLSIDMKALLRYYQAYAKPIAKLAQSARHKTISLIRPSETIEDGITIQEETIEDVIRDGEALLAEHCTDVGESPDNWRNKNIPIMRELENIGAIQMTTARCNGRLFGYLMALISPSLEYQEGLMAVHTLFYTSKDVKGLGMKLQRASVESLRQKGVVEVIFRAGVRGSVAGRIAALYKRMGAQDHGHLYKLDLG